MTIVDALQYERECTHTGERKTPIHRIDHDPSFGKLLRGRGRELSHNIKKQKSTEIGKVETNVGNFRFIYSLNDKQLNDINNSWVQQENAR
ncbi:MAG: hypothetical protein NPIRA02_27440 [Nitrospirales bacterium]|nr:MAG: hypothetical protein NPIRA02_27440 [Nitrospirales bacterium]